MQIVCGKCHAENSAKRRYCGSCGVLLDWVCTDCQWRNEANDRFCGGCGGAKPGVEVATDKPEASTRRSAIREISYRPISKTDRLIVDAPEIAGLADTSVQRRQVTALFADMTGYSRLANRLDAEEVHAITNRYRSLVDEIIESFDGIVPRHFGDAVLGLFGYPTAHSNDPERAIRSALAIHLAMHSLDRETGYDLKVHIGIASGTALVDSSGRQLELTGRAIILGSRLYDLAEPGETLIADTTYRAVAKVARCTEVGERSLKGFDSPAVVWRLEGLLDSTSLTALTPIVGRASELALVSDALKACRQDGCGQTFYIRGEAGIGKTRLLTECINVARREGYECHAGQILDFGLAADRDPIRMLVKTLLGIPESHSVDADAVSKAAASLTVDPAFVPILNYLFEIDQSDEQASIVDALDHTTRQLRIKQLLKELVNRRRTDKPLLIVMEDIHWASPQLLDQLEAISEAVTRAPVLLVLSSRPDDDPFQIIGLFQAMTTIVLENLAAAELRDLALQLDDRNRNIIELCVERSGGNPLFLEQLLRSKDQIIEETLPGSINSIVQSRVDRLADSERMVLQAASVIGQHFDMQVVNYLIEKEINDSESLVRNHLVQRDENGYRFSHALIREGVYGALLSDARETLHTRAAGWYEHRDSALWARHLGLAGSRDAVAAFKHVVEEKIRQYQYESALSLIHEAQQLDLKASDSVAFKFLEGDVRQQLGQISQAIELYRSIPGTGETDAEQCRARIQLASNLRVQDQLDQALDQLELAEEIANRVGLKSELCWIHHQRGNIYFPQRDIDACLEQHQLALSIAKETGSTEAEASALSGLGDANYQRGRMQTAASHFEQCINIATESGFVRIAVANRHMQGLARYFQCRLTEALSDCMAGADYAFDIGHHRAEMAARSSIGPIQLDAGDYDGAGVQAERGLTLARQLGARRFEPLCLTTNGRIAARRGDVDGALKLLAEALEIAEETGESFTAPWILGAIANISNDDKVSGDALAKGQRILDEGSLAHCHLWFYRDALDLYQRAGDIEGVLDTERRIKVFTQRESVPWMQFFVDCAKYRLGLPAPQETELKLRIKEFGFNDISLN